MPYLKKGVESWQVAFEAAGFRNAVIAKEAPSATEDPDWSPEDARYSVIRWLPSTIENASGPHVHDPRTGEILETDIQFYHNVMNLARNWYFVQENAVKFLLDNAFKVPGWAINPEILRRIEPVGLLDRIEASQTRVLNSLLSSARVLRMVEQSAIDGTAAYDPLDFLTDVRRGIWSELNTGGSVPIDAYRRNLQRAYVDTLSNRINGAPAQSDDARAFFRGELKTLDRDLEGALGRQTDRATTLHMQDVRMQIARALDPTYQAAASLTTTELTDYFDVSIEPESCWVDDAITPKRR